MVTQVKRRLLSVHPWYNQSRATVLATGNTLVLNNTSGNIYSRQITESEGHPWPKARGTGKDIGGPFDTLRLQYRASRYTEWDWDWVFNGSTRYFGACTDHIPGYAPPTVFSTDGLPDADYRNWVGEAGPGSLNAYGSKLIASAIPTNPLIDGAVSLAELYREGLPSMVGAAFLKDRASFFRNLGSEYLNVEFGWKPFISDLMGACKAISDSEAILASLTKYSGKKLARIRSLPEEVNVSASTARDKYAPGMNVPGSDLTSTFSTIATTTKTTSRTWFSGEFTYYFEPEQMSGVSEIATKARLLYGLTITPEVLWNLSPWSWLVDWFTNVGPLLHNVSAFQQDGLVMRYGYVMRHTIRTERKTLVGPTPKNGAGYDRNPFYQLYTGERKLRQRANPYGFGYLDSALTSRQISILAALGLSRS